MSLNQIIATIADVTGTTAANQNTLPVRVDAVGVGSDRTNAAKVATLTVIRSDTGGAAVVGNITVRGIDLPSHVGSKPLGNAFATAQTEDVEEQTLAAAQVNVDTQFTYADFAANNWMVQVQGESVLREVLATAGSPSGTQTKVADNSGKLRITFATAPGVGKVVRIYRTPTTAQTEILAAAAHMSERVNVVAKQVMWVTFSGIQTAANNTHVTLEPAVGA